MSKLEENKESLKKEIQEGKIPSQPVINMSSSSGTIHKFLCDQIGEVLGIEVDHVLINGQPISNIMVFGKSAPVVLDEESTEGTTEEV